MFYHLTQLAEDRDNCVGVSVTCVKLTAQDFEYFNLYTGSSISLGGMNGVYLLLSSPVRATIPEKSLGTPSHFCNICLGIYQFVPFLPVQCCLSWWSCHCSFTTLLWGTGLPILVMPLGIVPKTPCQHMFVLSDPVVPRTFVMYCSLFACTWIFSQLWMPICCKRKSSHLVAFNQNNICYLALLMSCVKFLLQQMMSHLSYERDTLLRDSEVSYKMCQVFFHPFWCEFSFYMLTTLCFCNTARDVPLLLI